MNLLLKSKILTEENEKIYYLKRCEELIGINFPREYLDQGFIRVFTDHKNKIVGGYMLILEGPLRTISSLPSYYQKQVEKLNLFEITGLWLAPCIKNGIYSCQFWIKALIDITKQYKRGSLVFSFDYDNDKLRSLYAYGSPVTLYEGRVAQLPGMKSAAIEVVQMINPRTLTVIPFKNLNFFLKRLQSGRNTVMKLTD